MTDFCSPVLQPNFPQAMALTALESVHKTKPLAHRIFSFRKSGRDYMVFQDMSRYFLSGTLGSSCHSSVLCATSMARLVVWTSFYESLRCSCYLGYCRSADSSTCLLVTATGTLVLGLNLLIGSSLQLFSHISSFYSCGTRLMPEIRSTLVPQWDFYNEGDLSSQHHSHRRQRHLCLGVQERTSPLS